MTYKFQSKNSGEGWSTIETSDEPRNVVVAYLANLHGGKRYPLYRVTGVAGTHLWTELNGDERSDKYLDRIVAEIYQVVSELRKQGEDK